MHDPVCSLRAVSLLVLVVACTAVGLLSGCHKLVADATQAAPAANEASVQAQLRSIQTAQNAFIARRDHYACTMAELGSQFGLLDRQLAYGHKDGYNYSIECSANVNPAYQAWATPADTGLMSPASYCIDQTGQMHHARHRLKSCSEGSPVN